VRIRDCLFAALAAAFEAVAMEPPRPTHVFYDLLVGKGNVLIATHTDGIYRTTDDGAHWERVLGDEHPPPGIVDAEGAGLLALPLGGQGKAYRSAAATGRRFCAARTHGDTSTSDGRSTSLYLSKDQGATWTLQGQLDQAIPPYRQIADLYVDARGTLYANTIRLLPKLARSASTRAPTPA
jgi:hypothetical protein